MPFYEDYGNDLFCHYLRGKGGYPFPVFHVHPHWELYSCAAPLEQITFINGQTITYTQPLAILCPPFSHHGTSVLEKAPFNRVVFYFGDAYLSQMGNQLFPLDAFQQSTACFFPLTEAAAAELLQLADQMQFAPPLEQKLLFAVFFHRLCALCPEADRRYIGQANSYIQDVMRYIVANLDKPMTVTSIAAAFYISRNKLSADFKQFTHTPLHQFIVNLRLERAKGLLQEKKPLSNREIAAHCGFENEYYFYEFFKAQTGMTPRDYVRQRQAGKAQKKPQ